MIPKIIHYVWVGTSPKSELVERCIESWRRHLPGYEIVEWNNERFAELDNRYAREAFAAGKWAFVSDYIRLYTLSRYGGFYFDSDLEVTGDLERFRGHRFVTGFENYQGKFAPITALMAAEPGNGIVEELLAAYDGRSFLKANGKYDLSPNTDAITRHFQSRFGVTPPFHGSSTLTLAEGCTVFPSFFFCTPEDGRENFAIHHFNGSWIGNYSRKLTISLFGHRLSLVKKKRETSFDNLVGDRERLVFSKRLSPRFHLLLARRVNVPAVGPARQSNRG
ncbi:glycosyltransferase [Aquamicrobium sp. LC103]|uniref:glycosyltransferase family 32 protein n=1 Tax=Aquamicrobium sp. LC103 TaxID=1120658 RepID=UPI00069C1226|nr:glycosyltransferase [Aquamicrobium sp. LC103]